MREGRLKEEADFLFLSRQLGLVRTRPSNMNRMDAAARVYPNVFPMVDDGAGP